MLWLEKTHLKSPGRLEEQLGVFTNREPDIHRPPNSPISKYAWRTKLFCLTCFLVVTLSAALHSSGLVSAGSALLCTGYWTFLSFVCTVCQMSGNHNPFFFSPPLLSILLSLCRDVRARKACEHYLQCDCEEMEWFSWKINKSCQSGVLCFSIKRSTHLSVKHHHELPLSNSSQRGEFLWSWFQYHFFKTELYFPHKTHLSVTIITLHYFVLFFKNRY